MREKGSSGVREDSACAILAVEQVGGGWTEAPEGQQRLQSQIPQTEFELLDY